MAQARLKAKLGFLCATPLPTSQEAGRHWATHKCPSSGGSGPAQSGHSTPGGQPVGPEQGLDVGGRGSGQEAAQVSVVGVPS